MIINLDETVLTDKIAECITDTLAECPKKFMKIAFVGVRKNQKYLFNKLSNICAAAFFDDYEKAKEWLF